METTHHSDRLTEQLLQALADAQHHTVGILLQRFVPEEIAEILEATPPFERHQLWELIPTPLQGEILAHTNDEVTSTLLQQLNPQEILEAVEELETDDIVDIAQALSTEEQRSLIQNLPASDREAVKIGLTYPEDSAGGIMSTDFISVREDVTFGAVIRLLRKMGDLPNALTHLIVADREGHYVGTLALHSLLTHKASTRVSDLVDKNVTAINSMTTAKSVAHRFEKHDLIATTVIDEHNKILGRITIDDVVDIIREEAEHSHMARAGLDDDDDLFAPAPKSAKRRTYWLGLNLLTAIFASFIISQFEESLEKIVALAILMPIIASMGGIAGTQTATIVIRAISTGKLSQANTKLLILKEAIVGILNGGIWAVLSFAGVMLLFNDWMLGIIFGSAMLINLIVAAFAGALIPLILCRMKIDPALAAGLILTTVTDSIGFFVFLGLATLIIL